MSVGRSLTAKDFGAAPKVAPKRLGWRQRSGVVVVPLRPEIVPAASYRAEIANLPDKSAGWREIGGKRCYFRSRWEANYARYLEWLKLRGEILEWEHEPETFWFEAIRRGTRSYLPDFRVTERNGRKDYHEVKGYMDAKSVVKIKRMKKYYPHVRMIVIDGKAYKAIAKTMKPILRGWE